MANHKSAIKRARQTEKRTLRNRLIKGQLKSALRQFREALQAGDKEKTEKALGTATRELRRAVTKGVLHARAASRRVSRLVLAANKAA